MKNILAENMLRFGVKNLSAKSKKKLTRKSKLDEQEQVAGAKQAPVATGAKQAPVATGAKQAPVATGAKKAPVAVDVIGKDEKAIIAAAKINKKVTPYVSPDSKLFYYPADKTTAANFAYSGVTMNVYGLRLYKISVTNNSGGGEPGAVYYMPELTPVGTVQIISSGGQGVLDSRGTFKDLDAADAYKVSTADYPTTTAELIKAAQESAASFEKIEAVDSALLKLFTSNIAPKLGATLTTAKAFWTTNSTTNPNINKLTAAIFKPGYANAKLVCNTLGGALA
jgi:hypothetical protein